MDMQEFLMQFESLGRNCEFGLYQRHFKSEPLGLLRWSSVSVASLIAALKARFEGFGTPEQSEITVNRGEYWIKDILFNITSHTSIRDVKANIEYVKKKQYPLLSFGRARLIENLEGCEKIFVYQHRDLTDSSIQDLSNVINTYGPNLLLCVRLPREDDGPGTIRVVNPNLMVGFIDREGIPGSDGWDISIDMWTKFCFAAHKQWVTLGHGEKK